MESAYMIFAHTYGMLIIGLAVFYDDICGGIFRWYTTVIALFMAVVETKWSFIMKFCANNPHEDGCKICVSYVHSDCESSYEVEIKCSRYNTGFIEEMRGQSVANATSASASDLNSDHDISSWAPILLGMLKDGLWWHHNQSRREEDAEANGNSEQVSELTSLHKIAHPCDQRLKKFPISRTNITIDLG